MKQNGRSIACLVLAAACVLRTPELCSAQLASSALSPEDVARMREQNDAFMKATSEALPVLKARLAKKEIQLTNLLDQLSKAEKDKDVAVADKLAKQIGEVDEEVSHLHAAQLDIRKLDAVSAMTAKDLAQENPSGRICNDKGGCGTVPAWLAIASILTGGLVGELNKKEPFGPNNEIMKGLHAIGDFVQCIFGCR